MKKRLVYIFLLLFLSQCYKNGDLYTFYRVTFNLTYKTLKGNELRTEAVPDKIRVLGGQPVIGAYYAEIEGEFTFVYDTIIQYGHVWSSDNPNPTLRDADTNHYTNLGAWETERSGKFVSRLTGLYPNSRFYVRSYIITSRGDTGYNPVVFSDTTLQAYDTWYRSTNLGQYGRTGAVAMPYKDASGNYKAIVGTGRAGYSLLSDMWVFDPTTEKWTQIANYPTNVTEAVGFVLKYKSPSGLDKMKAYLGTGNLNITGTEKSDFWFGYNFEDNTWDVLPSVALYPIKLSQAVAFTIGSYGYIAFGLDQQNEPVIEIYRFDPVKADQSGQYPWELMATLDRSYARFDAVAFVVDNYAFIGLGRNTAGQKFADFWKFDPSQGFNGLWLEVADFPGGARYDAVAMTIGSYGFVGLGTDGTSGFKDFYRFDYHLNQWFRCSDYKSGPDYDGQVQETRGAVAFGLGSAGFVGLGYKVNDTVSVPYAFDFWKYIP